MELLSDILQWVLLGATFAALGWAFPRRAAPARELSPERRRRMQKVYGLGNLAVLVLMVPAGWGALRGLQALGRAWHASPGADHVLIAGWVFWSLPALFLGILIGGAAVEVGLRVGLGAEGYRDLRAVMGEQLGADPDRAGLAVCGACLVLVVALVAMTLELSFVLAGDELRMDWPFHDAVQVPVTAVREIRELPRGRIQDGDRVRVLDHAHFRVVYGPGEADRWLSREYHGPAAIPEAVRAAMRTLSARSGVPVTVAPPAEPPAEPGGGAEEPETGA